MMSKKFLITSAASVLLCGGVVFAQNQVVEYVQQPNVVYVQAPVVNISNRHGNLRSAQQNIVSLPEDPERPGCQRRTAWRPRTTR
jgi:hypothetical protein